MGDLPWLWENGRPVGICQNVWGNSSGVWPYGKTAIPYGKMACVGGRGIAWRAAKTYGKCHGIWEPAPAYGEPPDRMGSLPQWQAWRDLRALHIFATAGSAAKTWAPLDWTALPLGWRQVAGVLVPLGSVVVWQWRSFKAGTGPHGSGAATARDGQPRIGSHPILGDSNPKPRLDSSLSTLGPAMGNGITFATVKISHKVLPPPS